MVVAVVAMHVVQVATHPVVDVRAVRDGGVAAAGSVLVPLRVDAAFVARLALLGVGVPDGDDVVVDVVAVHVVQVAVVQVVLVAVVHHFVVAAAVRVVVAVAGMLLAGVHGKTRQPLLPAQDKPRGPRCGVRGPSPTGAKPRRTLAGPLTGPLNLRRNRNAAPIERPWEDPRLDEGIRLYNDGHHWHAHEAWEPLWMGLEGDDKLFVQGLIMSAALLHQYGRKVPRGVSNHWANVTQRLGIQPDVKWGVDVVGLLTQLRPYVDAAARGDWGLVPAQVRITRSAGASART